MQSERGMLTLLFLDCFELLVNTAIKICLFFKFFIVCYLEQVVI